MTWLQAAKAAFVAVWVAVAAYHVLRSKPDPDPGAQFTKENDAAIRAALASACGALDASSVCSDVQVGGKNRPIGAVVISSNGASAPYGCDVVDARLALVTGAAKSDRHHRWKSLAGEVLIACDRDPSGELKLAAFLRPSGGPDGIDP